MYFKNLTVLGFKSIADETSPNLRPGVTAMIRQNGCDKSNVTVATRWVLSVQSAKALFGGEMADVIFKGTNRLWAKVTEDYSHHRPRFASHPTGELLVDEAAEALFQTSRRVPRETNSIFRMALHKAWTTVHRKSRPRRFDRAGSDLERYQLTA